MLNGRFTARSRKGGSDFAKMGFERLALRPDWRHDVSVDSQSQSRSAFVEATMRSARREGGYDRRIAVDDDAPSDSANSAQADAAGAVATCVLGLADASSGGMRLSDHAARSMI
jgi:hypothetical protein